jgi:type IV pilus assembly protein PilP
MKLIVAFFLSLIVSACGKQHDDLADYIVAVKQREVPVEDDVPKVAEFEHLRYVGSHDRDPFESPQAELLKTQESEAAAQCDMARLPERTKQALEQFGLDNLKMRGTMAEDGVVWALIQTPQGELFRVREGSYLGLNHGKIIDVQDTEIEIEEMVMDAKRCWASRRTQLKLLALN